LPIPVLQRKDKCATTILIVIEGGWGPDWGKPNQKRSWEEGRKPGLQGVLYTALHGKRRRQKRLGLKNFLRTNESVVGRPRERQREISVTASRGQIGGATRPTSAGSKRNRPRGRTRFPEGFECAAGRARKGGKLGKQTEKGDCRLNRSEETARAQAHPPFRIREANHSPSASACIITKVAWLCQQNEGPFQKAEVSESLSSC